MLRRRPETCPICNADVRDRIVCEGCGERVPGIERPARSITRPLLVAAVALAWGSYRFAGGDPRDVIIGLVHVVTALVLVLFVTRRPFARAIQAVLAGRGGETVSDESGDVTFRGRVRGVLGFRVDDPAVAEGRGAAARSGRFVVEGPLGQAVVDDDALHLGPFTYCVREGDEVEVRGPARRADPVDRDYRGQASRWVFDGTERSPVVVSAIARA